MMIYDINVLDDWWLFDVFELYQCIGWMKILSYSDIIMLL